MRKKYIEDNDEQDPELIKKVAPFYQRTSQILGGTQVAFVIYCGIFGLSLLGMVVFGYRLLLPLMGTELSWAVDLILAAAAIILLTAFWTGTILYPGTRALVEPLPILASHRWWYIGTGIFLSPLCRPVFSWCAAFSGFIRSPSGMK